MGFHAPQTAELFPDGDAFSLNIMTIIVQGQSMRRRSLKLSNLQASSDVAHVKQMVQGSLQGTPNEVHVMAGSEALDDSVLLSSLSAELQEMKAVVWYTDAGRSFDWEAWPLEEQGVLAASRFFTDPGPRSLPPDDADSVEKLGEVSRAPWQPPPPLLTRPRVKRQVDLLATEEERAGLEKGTLFEITVFANIFLGSHMHRRSCALAVSGRTMIAQVEERLEAWLGSCPHELTLTKDSSTLWPHQKLETIGVGPGARILAMASYPHASIRDLPPRMMPKRPLSAGDKLPPAEPQ